MNKGISLIFALIVFSPAIIAVESNTTNTLKRVAKNSGSKVSKLFNAMRKKLTRQSVTDRVEAPKGKRISISPTDDMTIPSREQLTQMHHADLEQTQANYEKKSLSQLWAEEEASTNSMFGSSANYLEAMKPVFKSQDTSFDSKKIAY